MDKPRPGCVWRSEDSWKEVSHLSFYHMCLGIKSRPSVLAAGTFASWAVYLGKKPHLVNSEGVRAPEPTDLWLQVVLCVCEPSLLRCTTSTLPPPLPPSLPSGLEPRALSSKAKILPLLYTPTQ